MKNSKRTFGISKFPSAYLFHGFSEIVFRKDTPRKDGRSQPRIEEPDEENWDYDDILPGNQETPTTGAAEKYNSGDPDHPDIAQSEEEGDLIPPTEEMVLLEDDETERDLTQEEIDRVITEEEIGDSSEIDYPETDQPEIDRPDETEFDREDDQPPEVIPSREGDDPEIEPVDPDPSVDPLEEEEIDPDVLSPGTD